MNYSQEQIEQLNNAFDEIEDEFRKRFYNKHIAVSYKVKRANEFFRHGFSRRFHMLFHCVDRVFEIYPPERTNVLEDSERFDIEVFIQAFTMNLYGAIDNLAWIVNAEKKLGLEEKSITNISLLNSKIQKYFTEEFIKYVNNENAGGFKKWYEEHCKDFRHALGHRIPLYVPPCGVINPERYNEIAYERRKAIISYDFDKVDELNNEEKSLEHIIPFYTHSFEENAPIVIFHSQLIADFRTLIELSDKFFEGFII